jgi:hypothetical protein
MINMRKNNKDQKFAPGSVPTCVSFIIICPFKNMTRELTASG